MIYDERRNIETRCVELFETLTGGKQLRQQCLRWAVAMTVSLTEHGKRACINCGTAHWMANSRPAPTPTHVGHAWQNWPDHRINAMLACGMLPECHCWAAVPDDNMIVDPSTRFVKQLATECGIPWDKDDPPETLWTDAADLPAGWVYVADERATHLAHQWAHDFLTKRTA